jgi:hypothetical protein
LDLHCSIKIEGLKLFLPLEVDQTLEAIKPSPGMDDLILTHYSQPHHRQILSHEPLILLLKAPFWCECISQAALKPSNIIFLEQSFNIISSRLQTIFFAN